MIRACPFFYSTQKLSTYRTLINLNELLTQRDTKFKTKGIQRVPNPPDYERKYLIFVFHFYSRNRNNTSMM